MSARLRDWTPADEPAVDALWRRVFGTARGGQTPAWLFREGPAGRAVRVVAEEEGRIVAHAGVAPLRFLLAGESVRGGYSVGAMTDPERQGRGLYVALARHLYERLEREGFAFVAGFSNRRSQRLMTGPLGRTAIRPFPWCVRPILPGRRKVALCGGALRIVACDPGDPRLDHVWARLAPTVRVAAVRDAAFFAWRYATRPEAGYECWLALGPDGEAVGGLVLRVLALRGIRSAFVLDLLADPGSPAAARELARAAIVRTRVAGARALSALLPPAGPVRAALLRAGFVRVPEALHPQVIRFSVRGLGRFAERAELQEAGAWWLSWADTDVV